MPLAAAMVGWGVGFKRRMSGQMPEHFLTGSIRPGPKALLQELARGHTVALLQIPRGFHMAKSGTRK